MNRLLCWLFAHRTPVVVWEPWRNHPDLDRYRILITMCPRCGGVLDIRSDVESEP